MMNEITNLIQKKQNSEEYQVYIDNQLAIECSLEIIKLMKLKVGKTITLEEIEEVKAEDERKKAYNKGLDYLSRRQRTSSEVRKYLAEKLFSSSAIEKALEKLQYYQFIDDEKYIDTYIKDQSQFNLKGKNRISQELLQKGLDKNTINESLSQVPFNQELENALQIGKKAFLQNINKPINQNKEKVSNKLYSKGFDWDVIRAVLDELDNNPELMDMVEDMEDNYRTVALKEAEGYFNKYSKKEQNKYKLKQKIVAALYRKGFDSQLIEEAVNKVME